MEQINNDDLKRILDSDPKLLEIRTKLSGLQSLQYEYTQEHFKEVMVGDTIMAPHTEQVRDQYSVYSYINSNTGREVRVPVSYIPRLIHDILNSFLGTPEDQTLLKYINNVALEKIISVETNSINTANKRYFNLVIRKKERGYNPGRPALDRHGTPLYQTTPGVYSQTFSREISLEQQENASTAGHNLITAKSDGEALFDLLVHKGIKAIRTPRRPGLNRKMAEYAKVASEIPSTSYVIRT